MFRWITKAQNFFQNRIQGLNLYGFFTITEVSELKQ